MRWLKFTANGQTSWGVLESDRVIAVSGDPFGEWQRTPRSHSLADVKVELPVMPRTFYCVGLNYLKHLKEAADKRGEVPNVPDRPEIGYRGQNALNASGSSSAAKSQSTSASPTRCPACSATPSATMSASVLVRRPIAGCGGPR